MSSPALVIEELATGVPHPPFRVPVLIVAPAVAFLAAAAIASLTTGIDIGFFSRDPTATMHVHPLIGVQSNVGILLWWGAASTSLLTAALTGGRGRLDSCAPFFLCSGVLTAILALDDLFLFHDRLAPSYLGISDELVQIGYGVALLVFLYRFRESIRRYDTGLFVLALVSFGCSVTIDFAQRWIETPWRIFYEDGFKFLGISAWSGYFVRASLVTLRRAPPWVSTLRCP